MIKIPLHIFYVLACVRNSKGNLLYEYLDGIFIDCERKFTVVRGNNLTVAIKNNSLQGKSFYISKDLINLALLECKLSRTQAKYIEVSLSHGAVKLACDDFSHQMPVILPYGADWVTATPAPSSLLPVVASNSVKTIEKIVSLLGATGYTNAFIDGEYRAVVNGYKADELFIRYTVIPPDNINAGRNSMIKIYDDFYLPK